MKTSITLVLILACLQGGFKDNLDLPVNRPSKELTSTELPPPPPEPPSLEEPPDFYGEPLVSENSTLCYVVDVSCSMGWDTKTYVDEEGNTKWGNRLTRAKCELRKSISSLPKNFKFNIVDYSCTLRKWSSILKEANEPNKLAATGYVNSLYPNGGTGTGPAVVLALQDKEVKKIVLLTDGAPGCGGSTPNVHRAMIKTHNTQGASVDVFGIGAYSTYKQFCQNVANDNNGAFIDVN